MPNSGEWIASHGAFEHRFVGDKAGTIEVIDPDTNRIVDSLPSEKNVHTLAVDPATHAVFVYRNESNKVDVFDRVQAAQ